MPTDLNTFGSTMPQPPSSIQRHSGTPLRITRIFMSSSALGSVNGKKLGRRRISASGPKNAFANCTSVDLRSTIETLRSTYKPSTWWNIE